jgi:E3 SUMO-protein ligase PIAS1
MSLKDPVSTVKIGIPCRSTLCTHNRCFDAECFLQLQEQAPTWQCPICNKTISFEALAVDEYVQEILDRAPRDTDQVTIEPDGRWSTENDHSTANNNGNGYDDEDSDEDLVEITDFRLSAIKSEAMHTPQSLARTPPAPSREASSAPRTGNKRASDFIDLTLSDDDEPARPTKKVAYSTPSSLPDPSRRYQLPSFGHPSVPMRPHAPSRHSMSSGLHMDAPSHSPQRPTLGSFRHQQPPTYPNQGSSSYPTYIGSSP